MIKLWKAFWKLSLATKLRTILQVLAYVNQFLIVLGTSPLGNSPVYQMVSLVIVIAITAVTYWYNNDWTGLAKVSTEIFDMLKDGSISNEEMNEFIESHSTKK